MHRCRVCTGRERAAGGSGRRGREGESAKRGRAGVARDDKGVGSERER